MKVLSIHNWCILKPEIEDTAYRCLQTTAARLRNVSSWPFLTSYLTTTGKRWGRVVTAHSADERLFFGGIDMLANTFVHTFSWKLFISCFYFLLLYEGHSFFFFLSIFNFPLVTFLDWLVISLYFHCFLSCKSKIALLKDVKRSKGRKLLHTLITQFYVATLFYFLLYNL